MSFQETLEIIESSKEYEYFIKQNPEAELITGFFVIDFFGNDNKKSLDYKYGEDKKKILSFSINELGKIKTYEDKMVESETKPFPELQTIEKQIKFDLEDAKSSAQIRSLDEGISAKFNKIIAVLQKHENKQVWNLTCMLEGLIILHVLIDANTGEIIKFERKSMMDLIRKK